ncbi:hypothetical protein HPULCUR_010634 [Helicostylum pulchrum]|uniref:Uncharacterized protein n=1 Tax=Helicostylum pulchrum TaxID=562976 RepID=A0ABP9YDT7_9FUNG
MNDRFPVDSGWVETPKIRKRMMGHDEKKKASSVPTTPVLQKDNHFNILSPPSSPTTSKKKKKKRPRAIHTNSNRSPLVNEITDEWDDHIVPCHQLEGLNITRNEPDPQPDEALRQISFLDYLKDELTVADFDSAQELKRERVTNFLGVPAAFEKFGQRTSFVQLRPSQKCDLLKGLMIIITCIVMWSMDPSRIYHSIRGQAVLKLYVVFNVLEICDKLCCSVGVDILDALFSKATLGNPDEGIGGAAYAKRQLKPITLFVLATGYMIIHTSVLFFQMITLNVAINFYSNALLSLLISNQFVEIKQSVFKKFEKENLFQLTCSDIVERFQQCAFLFIITLRNVIELSESGPSSILPSTFVPLFKLPASTSLNTLMTPVVMVISSELLVDWLKHAFITKFNQIRPSIYGKYIDVLCKDLVIGSPGRISGKNHAFVDQSPVVSRRIGFPVLPLACLYVRMMQQILPMMFMSQNTNQSANTSAAASVITNGLLNYLSNHQGMVNQVLPARIQLVVLSMVKCGWLENGLDKLFRFITWSLVVAILAVILLALKVVVGINLLGFAYKRFSSMEEREKKEATKEKEMKAMSKDETEYTASVRNYLSKPEDHVLGEKPIKYTLENVDRFSMVKSRIP